MAPRERASLPYVALAAVGVAYALTWALLPRDGFWVVDNCNKFLQMQSLLATGYRSAAIEWPGRAHDPDFLFNPIPFPFGIVREGAIHSQYAPFFALAASVPYRVAGMAGLPVLPILGGLGALAALPLLGRRLGMGGTAQALAVALAGVGTPLWFYSATFWEHTAAVCFCLWSLAAVLPRAGRSSSDLVLGGLLAAVAVAFRDELYLFLAAVSLAIVTTSGDGRARAVLWFAAGTVPGLAGLWAVNAFYTGNPMGVHAAVNLATSGGLLDHAGARAEVFHRLFLAHHANGWLSALLVAPYVVAALAVVRSPARERVLPAAWCLAAASAAAVLLLLFLSPSPLGALRSANSLFAAAPALALAFAAGRGDPDGRPAAPRRFLVVALAANALLYALCAPLISAQGVHWGNRFLLVCYPLLALLAADVLAGVIHAQPRRRAPALAAWTAVAVTVLAQVFSIGLLHRRTRFSSRLNAAVAARGERAVLAFSRPLPQEMYRVFQERSVFLAQDPAAQAEALQALRARLGGAGIHDILVVALSARPAPGVEVVADQWLGYAVSLSTLSLPRSTLAGAGAEPAAP